MANEVLESMTNSKHIDKKTNTYVMPGRGRKLCDSCQKYVGAKTKVCICGHVFVRGEHTTTSSSADLNSKYDEPITDENRRYALAVGLADGCRMVYAGAGPCPAELGSTCPCAVRQFCEDVVAAGIAQKKLYMPGAIKNWLASIIDRNIEAYVEMSNTVDDWYDEKVASTMGLEV